MRTTVMLLAALLFTMSTAHAQLGFPEIEYGDEFSARFVPKAERDEGGIPYNMYWFAGAEGQRISARVSSETFDPAVSVFRASDGRHVATAHGTREASLFTRLPADDLYFVTVTSLNRIDTAFYTFSLGAQAAREGNVLFHWEFPVSRPFKVAESAKCLLRYNAIAVVIGAKAQNSSCSHWSSTSYPGPIRIRAEMRVVSEAANAKAGLLFDRKPDGGLILVLIEPESNRYTVYQRTGTVWKTLVPETWSAAIKSEDWNTVDVELRNYSVGLTINRLPVKEIRLDSPVEGKVGLWNNGGSANGETTLIEFRELLVERLE